MNVHLPKDIEQDILDEVDRGHFASVDAAIVEAWRSYQRQRRTPQPAPGTGSIGALRDDADLLDQAVEHAMGVRGERSCRRLPDIADEARTLEGIRRGLEDVGAGQTQSAAEAFDDIRRELDLPRGS